ncbi:hypothetical protein [Fibrella forsythiae]|uniref:DUF3999 family protein n=1 Tax=Fibrella forsythiae TaxID=2817061 RepID=A0ABS3JTN0_9BACT|nr:hypothetical protein [Fibrella forsythiae]MBO0952798.1 hypothetical protein [Fibrella forsythiae]
MHVRTHFLIPFFLCFLPAYTVAQQAFLYKAQVGPVAASGYHRIELPPDLVGRLHEGLGDIRLYDGRKREIPYVMTRQTGVQATAFITYEVVRKTNVPNVSTTIVVKRPSRQPITALGVESQNTEVEKKATLSGSHDGNVWYALDDGIRLGNNTNATTTATLQTITFPLTDYTYFRLVVNDSTSAPLNIRRIGNYGQTNASAHYTPIPGLQFTQHDSSDHYTYLVLNRPSPARIDRLTIHVSNPAQFRRQAAFGHKFTETVARKRHQRPVLRQSFDPLIPFTLSSTGDTTITLPSVLTEKLCLRIANNDDAPLRVGRINAAQVTTYLTANLQAATTYQLQFGSMLAPGPVYDLAFFNDQLSGTLPIASVSNLTNWSGSPLSTSADESTDPFEFHQIALWVAILGIILLMGVMTYRMLTGMTREQQDA